VRVAHRRPAEQVRLGHDVPPASTFRKSPHPPSWYTILRRRQSRLVADLYFVTRDLTGVLGWACTTEGSRQKYLDLLDNPIKRKPR